MKIVNYWYSEAYAAYGYNCYDRNELIGYFTTKSLAKEAARGKGEWGSDGNVSDRPSQILTIEFGDGSTMSFPTDKSTILCETMADLEKVKKEKIRKIALAKLTKEEREALDLD